MKKTFLCLCLAIPFTTLTPACSSIALSPKTQVVAEQTLKAVGQTAEALVAASAQLYRDGKITAAQARSVLDFYNTKFQPAFRVALAAVQADSAAIAPADIVNLASQLAALVAPTK